MDLGAFLPLTSLALVGCALSVASFENQRWMRAKSRDVLGPGETFDAFVDISRLVFGLFCMAFLLAFSWQFGWQPAVGLFSICLLVRFIWGALVPDRFVIWLTGAVTIWPLVLLLGGQVTWFGLIGQQEGTARADEAAVRTHGSQDHVTQLEATATGHLLEAAALGDAKAMTALGMMYYRGDSIPQNYIEAANWFQRGAAAGSVRAMTKLGQMYSNGRGLPQNYAKAAHWFRKGAEAGDSVAMTSLAQIYDEGRGVRRDAKLAARWIFKALRAGEDIAFKEMTKRAEEWRVTFRRAFQQHLRDAGHYKGPIDGKFGRGTKRAIESAFQST